MSLPSFWILPNAHLIDSGDQLDTCFQELQEKFHDVLFTGLAGFSPRIPLSEFISDSEDLDTQDQDFDFSRTSVPKPRVVKYIGNWIAECAPHLDKFDGGRYFSLIVPSIAKRSPAIFYALLTFSAKQSERKLQRGECYYDSLEFYQASIELLAVELQRQDPASLVTSCILACMEFMSASPSDWRRHIKGCTALMESFNANGFSGGLFQAVFWCFARMDVCGAIMSEGAESTALHINKWISPSALRPNECREAAIRELFYRESRGNTEMNANWAVYLCAKACDLEFRRNKFLERDQSDTLESQLFENQWIQLWDDLNHWLEQRSTGMLPLRTSQSKNGQGFPEIFFMQWPAIFGNQLYHTACIIMLEMRLSARLKLPCTPQSSSSWHARGICGIALTNPHGGSLVNAIQPLYMAGKFLTHSNQHLILARLFKLIDQTTGWSTMGRLRDLEQFWGYEPKEIIAQLDRELCVV